MSKQITECYRQSRQRLKNLSLLIVRNGNLENLTEPNVTNGFHSISGLMPEWMVNMKNEYSIFQLMEEITTDNKNVINIEEVRTVIEIMNRKKIEQLINKALEERVIWQGEGKDKRWKFKTNDGKLIAKTSKEAITKAYEEYLQTEDANVERTFADLFQEWTDYRKTFSGTAPGQLSPSTLKRQIRDYNNYIKGTHFDNMNIAYIKSMDCEHFFKEMLTTHSLSKQCAKNVIGYVRGAFDYAYKTEMLNRNPMDRFCGRTILGLCATEKVNSSNRVLSRTEMSKLLSAIKTHEKDRYYIQDYAIELAMLTGMRVGELAGFKWECVQDEYIEIKYSERKYEFEDAPTEYIVGDTKNHLERTFIMTPELKELFERIKEVQKTQGISNEYVFANSNGRVSSHSISCAMNRRCEDAGIEVRSIHALRRTLSSNLRVNLPLATVAELLGHVEETNNNHYNYNVFGSNRIGESLHDIYKDFTVA